MTNEIGSSFLFNDLAKFVIDIASEKQARNVVMLDLREMSSFTDYFIILTADSERQMNSILEDIEQSLKKERIRPHHMEGSTDSGWILMDYGDIVVHIFSPQEREYYALEQLWSRASVIFRIQ